MLNTLFKGSVDYDEVLSDFSSDDWPIPTESQGYCRAYEKGKTWDLALTFLA